MSEFGLQEDDKQVILDILKAYPQIEEVALFGSRALNTFKATSDIDLAIKGKDIHTILAALIADFEESDLIYEVDLVDYASISTEKLLEHIDRHGKNFYRKGWLGTTLGKVIRTNVSSIGKDFEHNEILYLDTGSITKGNSKGVQRLSITDAPSRAKRLVTHGNIIYSTVRPNQEHYGFIENPKTNLVVSTGFVVIESNKNKSNSKFVYYFLTQRTIIDSLQQIAEQSTSTYPSIKPADIERLHINLPPLHEQKSIANILSSFDEKIELLREQNKTLETLAQTIFKEWFVNFNYPGASGERVDSELGEIPTNWQVKTIDELIELIIDYRGKTPKKLGMDWSDSGIPALSAKTIKNGKIVRRDAMNIGSKELYDIWMKDELERKDILLTSEAPLGEMYYLSDDSKYILSQRLFALRTNKEITSEYLYHYLFSSLGQYLLKSRASGSTVEGIRQSELRKVEVIVPEKEVMKKASSIFASVFEKTALNDKQIQNLINTRDSLLVKLMSGEVRVQGIIQ